MTKTFNTVYNLSASNINTNEALYASRFDIIFPLGLGNGDYINFDCEFMYFEHPTNLHDIGVYNPVILLKRYSSLQIMEYLVFLFKMKAKSKTILILMKNRKERQKTNWHLQIQYIEIFQ